MRKRQLWSSGHHNNKPDKWLEDFSLYGHAIHCDANYYMNCGTDTRREKDEVK